MYFSLRKLQLSQAYGYDLALYRVSLWEFFKCFANSKISSVEYVHTLHLKFLSTGITSSLDGILFSSLAETSILGEELLVRGDSKKLNACFTS